MCVCLMAVVVVVVGRVGESGGMPYPRILRSIRTDEYRQPLKDTIFGFSIMTNSSMRHKFLYILVYVINSLQEDTVPLPPNKLFVGIAVPAEPVTASCVHFYLICIRKWSSILHSTGTQPSTPTQSQLHLLTFYFGSCIHIFSLFAQ